MLAMFGPVRALHFLSLLASKLCLLKIPHVCAHVYAGAHTPKPGNGNVKTTVRSQCEAGSPSLPLLLRKGLVLHCLG